MDKPILHQDIFLSYYGDDFTGSTDVMESLALNGIPTALYLNPPDLKEVENFELKAGGSGQRIRAFGVAGVSRSMSIAEMDEELPSIFEKISRIPSDFFQLKICSTFDSSPFIGSIGHATEIALKYFPSKNIPLMVGAPFLNRFVVFGNLFARVDRTTYRLDRHPTMSRHPTTPMHESDLRIHLGKQTSLPVSLMDSFTLEGEYGEVSGQFESLKKSAEGFVLFDTFTREHLLTIGELLLNQKADRSQLIVGASGADWALALQLQQMQKVKKPGHIPHPGRALNMLVIAGSCSPVTAGQLEYMERKGHQGIRLDTLNLLDEAEAEKEMMSVVLQALQAMERGIVPLIYTARGPEDPAILETKQRMAQSGQSTSVAAWLAGIQGEIIERVMDKAGKIRLVVAGGDTSGYISRVLGIYALEFLAPIMPGAPLCIAHAKNKHYDGMEVALKGGQNGNEKYFESILIGELLS